MATLAFAVLLAALNSVLFSALRLRREAGQRTDDLDTRRQVRQLIERDLRNAILSGGLLASNVIGEANSQSGGRTDRLEFYTTTATVNDLAPWGEIQRVAYYTDDEVGFSFSTNLAGHTLVRAVSRNLLSEENDEEDLLTTPLLRDVDTLEFAYYDGSSWADSWDSTLMDNAAPSAVRVLVRFVDDPWRDWNIPPIEILVPWTVVPRTIETGGAEGTDAGGQDGENGGGNQPPPGGGGGGGGGNQPPGGGGGRG